MKDLLILSSVIHLTLCFYGDHKLHENLAESVVQVSNWFREHYHDDVTQLEPHVTSSMIVALRLAGYLPQTIMSDFKTNDSYSVADYLVSHLDSQKTQHQTLSKIAPGRIANIFQAISALCLDPENFHGHDLTKELFEGFKALTASTRKNYFEYSSVALAVCQSLGSNIQPDLAGDIFLEINKARSQMTQSCSKRPDSVAMTLMALSCLRRNIPESEEELLQDVSLAMRRYVDHVVDALRKQKDRSWNVQSKGLLVQAFMSLPKELKPRHWHCNRLLTAILNKHDPRTAFGNVLANIQILPALLGRSLVDLNTSCHAQQDSQVKANKLITVCVELVFQDQVKQQFAPDPVRLVVPEKTTAYQVLRLAAEQDDAYKFEALETSYGRMITAISNVKQDPDTGHYWALYASEHSLAPDGVDLFTPMDNTCVIFKYEKCSSIEDQTLT